MTTTKLAIVLTAAAMAACLVACNAMEDLDAIEVQEDGTEVNNTDENNLNDPVPLNNNEPPYNSSVPDNNRIVNNVLNNIDVVTCNDACHALKECSKLPPEMSRLACIDECNDHYRAGDQVYIFAAECFAEHPTCDDMETTCGPQLRDYFCLQICRAIEDQCQIPWDACAATCIDGAAECIMGFVTPGDPSLPCEDLQGCL